MRTSLPEFWGFGILYDYFPGFNQHGCFHRVSSNIILQFVIESRTCKDKAIFEYMRHEKSNF